MTICELMAFVAWHALGVETSSRHKEYLSGMPIEIPPPNYEAIFAKNLQLAKMPSEGRRNRRPRTSTVFFVQATRLLCIPMSPVDHQPLGGTSPLSRYDVIYLGPRSPAALKSDDSDAVSTENCGKSDISSEGSARSEGTKSSDPGYHTAKDLNISDTRYLHLNALSLDRLHDILTHSLAILK